MTRKKLLLAVGVVLAGFLVAGMASQGLTGIFSGEGSKTEEEIVVGASYPLSGSFSMYGKAELRGVELAVEEINEKGGIGGRKIDLVVEDNRFSPKKATRIANRFTSVEDVDVMMTGWNPTTRPIIPIIDRERTPTFTWIVHEVGNKSDYLFNDKVNFVKAAKVAGKRACDNGVREVAYLTMQWGGEKKVREALKKGLSECGGDLVSVQKFQTGKADFGSLLANVQQNEEVDAISLFTFVTDYPQFLKKVKELGLTDKTFLDLSAGSPEKMVSGKYGGILREMETTAVWYNLDRDNPETEEFVQKFKQEYGEEPRPEAAYTYDNMHMVKKAYKRCMEKGETGSRCLVSELQSLGSLEGAAGKARMDSDGDIQREVALLSYGSEGWEYIR